MFATLMLGLLLGMQHSLEPDHIAAVASLASGRLGPRSLLMHGASWCLGHGAVLFAVVGTVVFCDGIIKESLSDWLDLGVGVLLMGLGLHVLYRLWRQRVHVHGHRHAGGITHLHVHSHAGEHQRHKSSAHDHEHGTRLPLRTFVVGLLHGMAGSAALVVLTVSTVGSPLAGLSFVGLFAAGTMLGMVALSAAIAVPMSLSAGLLSRATASLQLGIGLLTTGMGMHMMHNRIAVLGAG